MTAAQWGSVVLGLAGAMVVVWFIINPPSDDALDRDHDDEDDEAQKPAE